MVEDKAWYRLSLVESLAIVTVLSLFSLPSFMLYFEYQKGSFELKTFYKIQQVIEDKIETACVLDFDLLPVGDTSGTVIEDTSGRKLDLSPLKIENFDVCFKMNVESINIDFSSIKNDEHLFIQKSSAYDSFKRIEIFAYWGKNNKNKLNLLTYRERS